MKEKLSAIIIRNVPESVRRELKARTAKDGKTMRGVILELIARYVAEKQGQDTPLPGDRGTYTPKTDYPLPSGGGYLVARGK